MKKHPRPDPSKVIAHMVSIKANMKAAVDRITECAGDMLARKGSLTVRCDSDGFKVMVDDSVSIQKAVAELSAIKKKYRL